MTGDVITSPIRVWSGSCLLRTTRYIKSRSLKIPARRPRSTTATAPICSSCMVRTACMTLASALTVTSGIRVILRRPIRHPRLFFGSGLIVHQRERECTSYMEYRIEMDPDMVLIPPGGFWMGSDCNYEWERPRHRVWLDAFEIARYPVIRREYTAFLRDTGHSEPAGWL